jgi:citrate/tricarballylate utilization protein
MHELESLCREAAEEFAALGKRETSLDPTMRFTPSEAEVARQMRICNACRYCEGFCAVFPAMSRRLEFTARDVHYLANLCHSCGACLHACQYAPPHEFAVNVPHAMAKVRWETYAGHAWPRALAVLYRRNGPFVAVATAAGLALFLALLGLSPPVHDGALQPFAGEFYAVFSHRLMSCVFGTAFGVAALAIGIGVTRFWRGMAAEKITAPAAGEAAKNVLALTYLDGGHGDGCNESDDRFTLARRRFHHVTFYGFLLCFASTVSAALYHYLGGVPAPYPIVSLPVLLGSVGGIGLLVGPTGLLWLHHRRHRDHGDPTQRPMDRGFILLLLLTSGSGLALLFGRGTGMMPVLLAMHLGAVLALFVTLPYGKFVHGIYRAAALLRWAIERRQPGKREQ